MNKLISGISSLTLHLLLLYVGWMGEWWDRWGSSRKGSNGRGWCSRGFGGKMQYWLLSSFFHAYIFMAQFYVLNCQLWVIVLCFTEALHWCCVWNVLYDFEVTILNDCKKKKNHVHWVGASYCLFMCGFWILEQRKQGT